MILKNTIKLKLNKLEETYLRLGKERQELDSLVAEWSKIYLPEEVNRRKTEFKKVIKESEKALKEETNKIVNDLQKSKADYIKGKFVNSREYQLKYEKFSKIANLNMNAFIDLIAENNDLETLKFLSNTDDVKLKSRINKAIYLIEHDKDTAILDKLCQVLSNGLRGNLLESSVKYILMEQQSLLDGLLEITPMTNTELSKYIKSGEKDELSELRRHLHSIEYQKKQAGEDYNTSIDQ